MSRRSFHALLLAHNLALLSNTHCVFSFSPLEIQNEVKNSSLVLILIKAKNLNTANVQCTFERESVAAPSCMHTCRLKYLQGICPLTKNQFTLSHAKLRDRPTRGNLQSVVLNKIFAKYV